MSSPTEKKLARTLHAETKAAYTTCLRAVLTARASAARKSLRSR
ncbi:hypothetical protein [Myxococcus phage Mx4 ts27htf-1hrm-1]|nr:hypothetical protein Mx4_p45 [Myxococcus phage Mx4]WNM70384.1 hypothetical protein [Myxococcus phage Mx4 ts27htf-1hrm-1]